MKSERADKALEAIDNFYALEQQLSELDKLRYGLARGVEIGILTSDEAVLCERAFLKALNGQTD